MQPMICRENYLLTQKFLAHLTDSVSPKSAGRYRFYLRHLLLWAMDTHLSQAPKIHPDFSSYVAGVASPMGESLTPESQKKIFNMARQFFEWAKMEYPLEFKPVDNLWVNKLRLPKHSSDARSRGDLNLKLLLDDADSLDTDLDFVRLEEVSVLANLPKSEGDLAHWRDRAMAAFLYLSAARAQAAVTIPIGAVHFEKMKIRQWPSLGVETKKSKSATTYLHNIPELVEVAQSWDAYVRTRLPLTAAWYAPVESQWGEQWLSNKPIGKNRGVGLNKRLRILYSEANLPYKSAHKFRHGHAVYGLQRCRTMADYKALSLNMMHESLEITDSIYVHMLNQEVGERIHAFIRPTEFSPDTDFMTAMASLSKEEKLNAISFLAQELAK